MPETAWALSVGADLAVGGDGAVDEAGVELLQGFIPQAQAIHDAGAVALHQDVRVRDHLFEDRNGFRILQVQYQGLLAPVAGHMREAGAVHHGHEETVVVPGDGLLDMDDFGVVIGQQGACHGAGEVVGHVDDFDARIEIFMHK